MVVVRGNMFGCIWGMWGKINS